MQTLSFAGAAYRTKLLSATQAQRFAACLQANSSFSAVAVEESPRAKSADRKHFVSYVPANAARRAEMIEREQDARVVRGFTEGSDYVFCLDDSHRFFWCLSTSGEVYEVTSASCSCPDHTFRCKPNGLKCKHQIALREGVGTVQSF
jgi:predicted nucleic acid-binding Zn finger protein